MLKIKYSNTAKILLHIVVFLVTGISLITIWLFILYRTGKNINNDNNEDANEHKYKTPQNKEITAQKDKKLLTELEKQASKSEEKNNEITENTRSINTELTAKNKYKNNQKDFVSNTPKKRRIKYLPSEINMKNTAEELSEDSSIKDKKGDFRSFTNENSNDQSKNYKNPNNKYSDINSSLKNHSYNIFEMKNNVETNTIYSEENIPPLKQSEDGHKEAISDTKKEATDTLTADFKQHSVFKMSLDNSNGENDISHKIKKISALRKVKPSISNEKLSSVNDQGKNITADLSEQSKEEKGFKINPSYNNLNQEVVKNNETSAKLAFEKDIQNLNSDKPIYDSDTEEFEMIRIYSNEDEEENTDAEDMLQKVVDHFKEVKALVEINNESLKNAIDELQEKK